MPNKEGVRSALDLGPRLESYRFRTTGKSRTKQSAKDECDINNIMKKYHRTGLLPSVNADGVYADVAVLGDFKTAYDQVIRAQELFDSLPSRVRERFDNSPQALLEFCQDDKNLKEAVELGLANDRVLNPPSQPAPVSDPTPKGSPASAPT